MDGCTQSLLLNPNKEEIPGNYNPVIGPIRQETRACVPGGDIGTCDGKVTSDGVCFSGGAGEAQQPASQPPG